MLSMKEKTIETNLVHGVGVVATGHEQLPNVNIVLLLLTVVVVVVVVVVMIGDQHVIEIVR
jgi:hypothetical protein